MNEFKIHHGGLPVGILSAAFVTLLLFIALPLLTTMQRSFDAKKQSQVTLIKSVKPKPLQTEERDEPKKQEMKQKEARKEVKQARRAQPKFDAPRVSAGMSGSNVGGVQIAMTRDFNVSDSLFMSAFNMNEVDQHPSVIRSFNPQYPYLAKRDNIEGKIILRFVVDADGSVQEPEVVSADPPEVLEIFSEAALRAVVRYKFKPAVKNGKNVMCIVKLPIGFELE